MNIIQKFGVLFLLLISSISLSADQDSTTPTILVSVSPYKYFVEKIAGNSVKVEVMVPAGASSHTFEPTPKQMINAAKAAVWFQIGEGFESRAGQALKASNPSLFFVDLRTNVDLIHEHHCSHAEHNHHASCIDPHFWLSARQAKAQARTIADTLSSLYPDYKDNYQSELNNFIEELDKLDSQITELLEPLKNRIIMVSHPAYAYFCRDYQLAQLSIEFEGKDPTPSQLTKILDAGRKYKITRVYTQPQYSNKGATLIAKELKATVVSLDPYSENYLNTMLEIAKAFSKN